MCARYTLTKEELAILIGEIEIIINVGARYNIAPGRLIKTIIRDPRRIKILDMHWGWERTGGGFLVNAKAENLDTVFNQYIGQRCLIPADGFYEWTGPANDRQPIRFTKPGNVPFCFAGLWRETTHKPQDVEFTEPAVVIITTTPNKSVGRIHNRMPLIVQPAHYDWWLQGGELFRTVLDNPDREELDYCPVQPSVNSVKNEGPDLIRPHVKSQRELF